MDPLIICINEDDRFGDGNNFEIVLQHSAADALAFIESERERRKQLLIDEQLRAALEKLRPRSQKKRVVKPWISLGSEAEIEEVRKIEKIRKCGKA